MKGVAVFAAAGALVAALPAWAQAPTPLSDLLTEAAQHNPEVASARHAWLAATHVRAQVSTLPNPQFTFQDFSVGGAYPWSGLNTSSFAYIGFGASQELPFPGKLRLKGEAADREADVRRAEIGLTEASVAGEIKNDYFRLAYLQQILGLIQTSRHTLGQVVQSELFRYRTGGGDEAAVLKAQLEQTQLLREATVRREQKSQMEADLKLLLRRSQDSPDIVAEPLAATKLRYSSDELLAFARSQNPQVQVQTQAVRKQEADLRSAKRSGKPDFSVGYMFQRTGTEYPAYYMLTLNLIWQRRQRTQAKVAEAAELAISARDQLDAQLQQQQAEIKKQYVVATSTAQQASEFRQGLIPQAEAVYNASLAEYESNKRQLASVLDSFNGMLQLKREYAESLFQHEAAIGQLETLTGVKLQ